MQIKSRRKNNIFFNIKNLICDCFYQSKIKFFIIGFVVLVALLTGIIVAIKCYSGSTLADLGRYGLVDMSNGMTSSFFSRLMSMIFVMLLLFGFSYTKFCMPLALILIAYRTYLIGLNLTIMFILFGLPGMIVSLLIALPCQLIALAIMCVFYLCQCNCTKEFSCCHGAKGGQKLQLLILGLICLVLICLIETLLLVLLSAKVILVI